MEELILLLQFKEKYKDRSAICLTETWLDNTVPDQAVTLSGYLLRRANRSAKLSTKSKGSGICLVINQQWCTNITVLHTCCPLPTPGIHCFQIYIPPLAIANITINELACYVSCTEHSHHHTAVIVQSDFAHSGLSTEIPTTTYKRYCIPAEDPNTTWHSVGPKQELQPCRCACHPNILKEAVSQNVT